MYAIVYTKQIREVVKQLKLLGCYAVKIVKKGDELKLYSYTMPNNVYNDAGVPQYYSCDIITCVEIGLAMVPPKDESIFDFITTLEDLKSGMSCESGGLMKIEFDGTKASISGSYSQSLKVIDQKESNIVFENIKWDDMIPVTVLTESLRFACAFVADEDDTRETFDMVCVEEGGVVATDGHFLGVKEWHSGFSEGLKYGLKIPILNKVAKVISECGAETATLTALLKDVEIFDPKTQTKVKETRLSGTMIESGNYRIRTKSREKLWQFPDFKKVLPQNVDNHFLINADNWCKTIASAIKGYNCPLVKISEEGDYFVFNIHENRQRKGKYLDDRQVKLPKTTKLEYQWIPFQVDAKLLCKELKAHDSSTAVLSIHDCMIIMESWAGKSVLMFMD